MPCKLDSWAWAYIGSLFGLGLIISGGVAGYRASTYISGTCTGTSVTCSSHKPAIAMGCVEWQSEDGTLHGSRWLDAISTYPSIYPAKCWGDGVSAVTTADPTRNVIIVLVIFGALTLGCCLYSVYKLQNEADSCVELRHGCKQQMCCVACFWIFVFIAGLICLGVFGTMATAAQRVTCTQYSSTGSDIQALFGNTWAYVDGSSPLPSKLPATCWYGSGWITFLNPMVPVYLVIGALALLALLCWLNLRWLLRGGNRVVPDIESPASSST